MQFFTRITRRHLRIAAIGLVSCLILFALLGFFAAPPLLRSVLASRLSEALHRQVTIQELRVNPFALSVTIRGFKIAEPAGAETFLGFEELYVNAEMASIFRLGPVLREIRLTRPTLRLVRQAEEKYNISDLLAPPAAAKPAEPAAPLRFSLNNISVLDGSIDLVDQPMDRTHTVRGFTLGLPFISNIPSQIQIFTEPKIEARINDDLYVIRGKTKPFADTLESSFEIDIAGLDIPKYLAYSPVPLKFKVPSGALDIKTTLTFIRQQERQSLTVQGSVALKEFALTDRRDAPVVTLPLVEIGIAPSEPLARKIHLAALTIQDPTVALRREQDGTINLQALLPDPPKPTPAAPAPAEPAPALTLLVDAIRLTGGKLAFTDLVPAKPFRTTLAPIELTVNGLGSAPEARATLQASLRTEVGEELRAEGEITLAPPAATIKTATRGIVLARYAPYYQDLVRFTLQKGTLDTDATLHYAAGKESPQLRVSEAGLTLRELAIAPEDDSGEYLRVPILTVKETEADLTARQVTVGSVSTQKGSVRIARDAKGNPVLFRLLEAPAEAGPPPAAPPAAASPAPAPWKLLLRRLALEQYALTLDDRSTSPPTSVALDGLKLTAQDVSTAKGSPGKLALEFRLDQSGTVRLGTSLSLEPLAAEGSLEVSRIPLRRYAPYYRPFVGFEIDEGVTDLATRFSYAAPDRQPDVKLSGLALSLENLKLRLPREDEPLLAVPALAVRNGALDLRRREVSLGEVTSSRGALRVLRRKDGALNLQELLPPAPAAPATAAGAAVSAPAGEASAPPPAAPWVATVGSLALSDYQVDVADRVPSRPVAVAISQIGLQAEGLSTRPDARGKVTLALRINRTGALTVGGTVGIAPLSAALDVGLTDLDIRPLQPYFTDQLQIVVSDGSVSAAGQLSLADRGAAGLGVTYTGGVSVNSFASIDRAKAEDFLRWQSFALTEMEVGTNPFRFRAKKLALSDYYARLVLHGDGSLNLHDILAKGAAPAAESPAAAPPAPAAAPPVAPAAESAREVQIDEITLQGGRINFTDRSVRPSYSATMVEMGGRVSGLSSALNTVADLNLQGKLENSAPLEMTGKINPLAKDLFVDLKVRVRDIELSSATPYSGKYIGYTIQKGKLTLNLQYLIEKRKLESQNVISLDQFTLGEAVESPLATKLPVKLAIALLKDRNGEINLDIPVTGSLDDPQFSVWKIVFQILGNLIVKAVASPFALLGAAFGGGEQLSFLEFDYGTADFTAEARKKLDGLTKALVDRPSLRLDMESFVDVERDRESLRQLQFRRKLQLQKALDQSRRGQPPLPAEGVKIEPQEYERYLRMAYRAEKFPKPRNLVGLTKSLPVAEMEKLILTHIQVTDDDLQGLAARRAAAVKEALIRGQVKAERVFILTPRSLAPEKKEKQKDSRIEFKIG